MSIARDARFWDKSSRRYARSAVADPGGYERTLARTRDYLGPEDSVLELGCGTGTTALRLAEGVQSYLGTDISGAMIAIAQDRLAAEPVPALSFRTATAEELARTESRFDAVLGFNYLHLLRDVPGTLRSIHLLLRPAGLLITKTPCLGDMNPLIGMLLLPAMQAARMAPHATSFGASALERLIVGAGFDILVTERHATKGTDRRPYIVARRR